MAKVNSLTFNETGCPKWRSPSHSIKESGAGDSFWQNLKGKVEGEAVNLFLPPVEEWKPGDAGVRPGARFPVRRPSPSPVRQKIRSSAVTTTPILRRSDSVRLENFNAKAPGRKEDFAPKHSSDRTVSFGQGVNFVPPLCAFASLQCYSEELRILSKIIAAKERKEHKEKSLYDQFPWCVLKV